MSDVEWMTLWNKRAGLLLNLQRGWGIPEQLKEELKKTEKELDFALKKRTDYCKQFECRNLKLGKSDFCEDHQFSRWK